MSRHNGFNKSAKSISFTESSVVHPCVIAGQKTLVYERGLKEKEPDAYVLIYRFAQQNAYKLKEDQRADFIEGIKRVKNNHRANVISTMVITASLLSQPAFAMKKTSLDISHAIDEINYAQHIPDLDMEKYTTEQELMKALITWINQHSDFDHNISDLPEIVKVSANKMLQVAFGGPLPKAVDPTSLKIYGLYNFNEKAIYILDKVDMTTYAGKAILLHELVHFLQYQYGRDEGLACKNELESLAYFLEARYLTSHGHTSDISLGHIKRVSQC